MHHANQTAPYNDAMRLGMGFNSFTQKLCVNDAVKLKGNIDNNSANITQDVNWTAKFVDDISEVAKAMNVSASVLIKSDAMSGGSAAASFIDTNSFNDSDINYLIQVKVTTERLAAPDDTEFYPIDRVVDSEFSRVYGDSFISGFIEGGEFTTLVSIKLKDRSQKMDIRRQLKACFNFQAQSTSDGGELATKNLASRIAGGTTISVLRRGGEDIEEGNFANWTLEALKGAARKFPGHVKACPVRTHAILTKYTALKSFYEKSPNGSLLDYENAAVYSSALLDAYMDYKFIRRNIQTAVREVERGASELIAKPATLELAELSLMADASQQAATCKRGLANERTTAPTEKAQSDDDTFMFDGASISSSMSFVSHISHLDTPAATSQESVAPASATDAAPLPAQLPNLSNGPVPYKASILGLEKARRDCELEMTKIVREVDMVANDPEIACDPNRSWQYLSPAIFRLLIPSVKNLEDEMAALLELEKAEKLHEEKLKVEKQLRCELLETHKELETVRERLKQTETVKKEINPWEESCPMPPGMPIRLRAWVSKKSIDFCWDDGKGHRSVHQYETLKIPNQQWTLERVGPVGFAIRHMQSGRYLTTGHQGESGLFYMTTHEMPAVYRFEPRENGLFFISLIDKPHFTLNLEYRGCDNEIKIIVWPHDKGDCDLWYIKLWDDLDL